MGGCAHFPKSAGHLVNDGFKKLRELSRETKPYDDGSQMYDDVPPWEPLPESTLPPGAAEWVEDSGIPTEDMSNYVKTEIEDLYTHYTDPKDDFPKDQLESARDLLLAGLLQKKKGEASTPKPEERVFLVIYQDAQLAQDSESLLKDHIKYLGKKAKNGHIGPYGPFSDKKRGFAIFFAETAQDVIKHVSEDPLISKKYYLNFEVHEVMGVRV